MKTALIFSFQVRLKSTVEHVLRRTLKNSHPLSIITFEVKGTLNCKKKKKRKEKMREQKERKNEITVNAIQFLF